MGLMIYPKRAQVGLSSNLRVFTGLMGGFSPKVEKYYQIEYSGAPFICSDVHLFVILDTPLQTDTEEKAECLCKMQKLYKLDSGTSASRLNRKEIHAGFPFKRTDPSR